MFGRMIFASVTPPTLAWYADVPSSLVAGPNRTLAAWGAANGPNVGNPRTALDSVTPLVGSTVVRTTANDKLYTPAGAASFLGTGPSTIIIVWRYRMGSNNVKELILDATEVGTQNGYQLQVGSFPGQLGGYNRSIAARIWNGSAWILDTPIQSAIDGMWVCEKWTLATVRVSNTKFDIRVDGQFTVEYGGTSYAFAYPTAGNGRLSIGGGAQDFKAIELYNSYLTDAQVAVAEARLANRFAVDMIKILAGDPTMVVGSAMFPALSKLPNGKLYATAYNGFDGPTATDSNSAFVSNDAAGSSWGPGVTLTTNTNNLRWGDLLTSEKLSDGSLLQAVATTYDSGNNAQFPQVRRATTFNADGSPIWGPWVVLNVGTPTWAQASCQPQEDPANPGHIHLGVYSQEGAADTFWSIWDYQSTDFGNTWSRVRIANGVTDSKKYAEPGLFFDTVAGDIYCLIRDATINGTNPMLQSQSTNLGVTWTAPAAGAPGAWSSGQEARKLASGRYAWMGRALGGTPNATIYWRAAGAAWNAAWQTFISGTSFLVDPLNGLFYYAGIYEVSPGNMTLLWGRTGGNTMHGNVAYRNNFYEWYLSFAMPFTTVATTGTVTANSINQIVLSGAGGYVFNFTQNQSGAIGSDDGYYYPGGGNGTDIFTIADINGQSLGTFTYTVTGGGLIPTSIDAANLTAWWDPRRGITLQAANGNIISNWLTQDASALNLGTYSDNPTTVLGPLGHVAIAFDGVDDTFLLNTAGSTMAHYLGAATNSWTFAWISFDNGNTQPSGTFHYGTIFADGTTGQFGIGSTSTTVYAGSGSDSTKFDVANHTAGWHYYVAQYDSAAGKVFISVDGGPFDAGTAVLAMTDLTGYTMLGRNFVTGALFNGMLGDVAIWKSKLTGANLTNLQAFLAAHLP